MYAKRSRWTRCGKGSTNFLLCFAGEREGGRKFGGRLQWGLKHETGKSSLKVAVWPPENCDCVLNLKAVVEWPSLKEEIQPLLCTYSPENYAALHVKVTMNENITDIYVLPNRNCHWVSINFLLDTLRPIEEVQYLTHTLNM